MDLTALWDQARAQTGFSVLDVALAVYATRIEREAVMYALPPETYAAGIAEEEARRDVAASPDPAAFALVRTVQPSLLSEEAIVGQYRQGRAILERARLVTARVKRDLDQPDSPAIRTPDGWTALKRLG